jgi:hypothetical protein
MTCGPQKFNPVSRSRLSQAVFMVQPAELAPHLELKITDLH